MLTGQSWQVINASYNSLYGDSGSQSGGGVDCDSPANCVCLLVDTNIGTSYTP